MKYLLTSSMLWDTVSIMENNRRDELKSFARRTVRDDYVTAMREGRRQRAITYRSKKTYRRKTKHGGYTE